MIDEPELDEWGDPLLVVGVGIGQDGLPNNRHGKRARVAIARAKGRAVS